MPNEFDGLIKESGASWQLPIKPRQTVSIAIDGVVCKEFTADDYATMQVKWWLQIIKQK